MLTEYETLLEPSEVARMAGLSAVGVKFAADRGELPIAMRTRRGGRLFREADVQEWIDRREERQRKRSAERA